MEWLTPTITQYVQIRNLWGSNQNKRWTSGIEDGVRKGQSDEMDSPDRSRPYTVAWYAYFKIDVRAYNKLDDNINDSNIYLQVNITTIHNKIWTSIDEVADGFIDIGVLVWDPTRAPFQETSVSNTLYLHDQDASENQLYTWAGIQEPNIVCGIVADNGYRTGKAVPGGSWGTHADGNDVPVATRTFTLTFSENSFDDSGNLKPEYATMPFVYADRWHDVNDRTKIGMRVVRTVDIDLSIDPFIYIPWGIMKSGSYVSCNRRNDGLTVYKDGSFGHVVRNSILARVINNKFPTSANGFRINKNKWDVSPITPSYD